MTGGANLYISMLNHLCLIGNPSSNDSVNHRELTVLQALFGRELFYSRRLVVPLETSDKTSQTPLWVCGLLE